jgi:hypothetical protein
MDPGKRLERRQCSNPGKKPNAGKRPAFPLISLLLGILSLVAWRLPGLGLGINLLGLIMGVQTLRGVAMPDLRHEEKRLALAGVVLSGLGLFASVGYFAYRMYLVVTR